MKNRENYRILNYFWKQKVVNHVHGLGDQRRSRSTVYRSREAAVGSLELALGAAPVSGSSASFEEKGEELWGVLTVGESGQHIEGVRPAVRSSAGGDWCSTGRRSVRKTRFQKIKIIFQGSLAGRFRKRNKKKIEIGWAARGFWAKIRSGRLRKIKIIFRFSDSREWDSNEKI
jgi:hypothetical protein